MMSDTELAAFCGFKPTDNQEAVAKFIANLTPAKRAMMEKMRQIELWDASGGLIPLPDGVIVCGQRQIKRHKGNS